MQQPQQQMGGPTYLAEFDPYASIGQGWDGSSGQTRQQQQRQPQQQQTYGQPTTNENLHPREFIRKYKVELESWDTVTWKQMQNTFESLKAAWEKRMHEIEARLKQVSTNWGMAAQQEMQQGQHLLKDAESKFSSVAASTFQIKEVLQGYRHSTDIASKRRVREAMNAALQSLPDWPPLNY